MATFQAKQIESAIETAVQYVQNNSTSHVDNLREEIDSQDLATKKDLLEVKHELKGEIGNLRTELKEDIANLRTELKGDIASLRIEVKDEINDVRLEVSNLRGDTIKFVVWTGVSVVIAVAGMMGGMLTVMAR